MRSTGIYFVCLVFLLFAGANGCKKSSGSSGPVVDNSITYDVSNDIFPNPERGFIHTYPVYSGGASLNLAALNLLRAQSISLILRVFYLDNFKTQAINAAELTLIQTDLDKIREAGLKGILRFAYTDDIAGTDASYAIIEQHLDQLKSIFETNKDIIAFVQVAIYVGEFLRLYDLLKLIKAIVNFLTYLLHFRGHGHPDAATYKALARFQMKIITGKNRFTAAAVDAGAHIILVR